MRSLHNYSVRGKIILVVVLCTVLSVVIFFGMTFPRIQRDLAQTVERNYQLSLNTVGARLDQAFYDMHLTAAKLTLSGGTTAQVQEYLLSQDLLEQIELRKTVQRQLIVEDAFSSLVGTLCYYYPGSTEDMKIIANINNLSSFRAEGEEILFGMMPYTTFNYPRASVKSDELVLSLTRYAGDAGSRGKGEYYLYMETDPEFLADLFDELMDHDGVQLPVYLLDRDGRVIYFTGEGPLDLQDSFSQDLVEGYVPFAYESENWSLQLCVPAKDYEQIEFSVMADFVLIMILFVLIYVFLAVFIFQAVYRPLDSFLKDLSDNTMAGLYRNSSHRYRELDEFTHKIEQMRRRISQLIDNVEQQSKQNAYLENQLLLSRINPHFLHNTLNSISIQASGEGQDDLSETIRSLNNLLYHNLGKNKITTLRDELRAVEDYIFLQHRIQQFSYEQEILVEDAALELQMPAFVLQPLIENCFKHGKSAQLCIRLRIGYDERDLLIVLDDNGQGMSPEMQETLNRQFRSANPQGTGIGLGYVSSSLQLYFADRAEVHVSDTDSGQGTRITIRILNPGQWQ